MEEKQLTILQQHFRARKKILLAEYELSKELKSARNLGDVRELFVRNFLSGHLPTKINYGRGEIIDASNANTGEIDIILYRDDSPVLSIGGSAVFLCEGVYAAIEVKSNLSNLKNKEITSAIDKLIKVNNLKRKVELSFASINKNKPITTTYPIDLRPRSYLIALEGPTMGTLRKKLEKQYAEKGLRLRDMPDLIVVLNRGYICKRDDPNLPLIMEPHPGKEDINYVAVDAPEDCLLILFMHLLKGLTRFSLASWDYRTYLPKGQPE